jgi:hypothetical protein
MSVVCNTLSLPSVSQFFAFANIPTLQAHKLFLKHLNISLTQDLKISNLPRCSKCAFDDANSAFTYEGFVMKPLICRHHSDSSYHWGFGMSLVTSYLADSSIFHRTFAQSQMVFQVGDGPWVCQSPFFWGVLYT